MYKSNRGTVSGYFLAGRFMTFLPVCGVILMVSGSFDKHLFSLLPDLGATSPKIILLFGVM